MVRTHLRRGGAFVLVLAASLLVAVLGTAALLAARLEYRAIASGDDMAEARTHAWSAINVALQLIQDDSNWRTTYGNSNWPTNRTIGGGAFTIEASDPVDGDVKVGPSDPVLITGIGLKNKARHKIRVMLSPPYGSVPLDVLDTSVHSDTEVSVLAGSTLTAIGGAVSSNDVVTNDGTILADVEAANTVTNNGFIGGTVTVPVPVKQMPLTTVFEMYEDIATALPYSGVLDGKVLAPGYNDYGGGLNTDGVYFIDTGGSNLVIKNSRIYGTLVVRCGAGKSVVVQDAAFLHPYRPYYPVLLVRGDADIRMDSGLGDLEELPLGTNFNPPGAPYSGEADTDTFDSYPSEIRGLIHVTGTVTLTRTARMRGVLISDGRVEEQDDNLIIHDPSLSTNPPLGYTELDTAAPVEIVPWSWERIVD